jgi:UDP-N-acetylmuramoyl-tripeptide--D-alanyl-D-alanine ligase
MVMTGVVLGETMTFRIPSPGRHMLYSVLMAAAIGKTYGMTTQEIAQGVASFVPSGKRMFRIPRQDGITLIDDTYNANPQAVKAVLSILGRRPEQKKIAVLGDMLELGEQENQLHHACGVCAREQGIDVLIAVGERSAATAEGAQGGSTKSLWFADKEEALKALAEELVPDCVVLFKASHSMHFDQLVEGAKELTQPL